MKQGTKKCPVMKNSKYAASGGVLLGIAKAYWTCGFKCRRKKGK